MTTGKRSQGWFEQMRRDGALFALVCALILVANLFQPMAQAGAAGQDEAWTICTTHGVSQAAPAEPHKGPEHPHDCCMAGNHCGGLSAPKLLVSAEPAFAPPAVLAEPARAAASQVQPGGLPADSPPAIRAPPPFA